jgi:hypothetical protein
MVEWDDLIRGPQHINTAGLSDPVLVREDGSYLYTFTSVVDDIDFGITHVIRGEDHVVNTAVQIEITEALGGQPPRYAHHSLLTGADGKGLRRVLELKDGAEIDSLSWGRRILSGKRDPLVGGQALLFSAQGRLYQYAMPSKGKPCLESLSYLFGGSVYGKPAFQYPVWSPKKPILAYSAEGDIWLA